MRVYEGNLVSEKIKVGIVVALCRYNVDSLKDQTWAGAYLQQTQHTPP